jgi:hypothetical protein
MFGAVFWKFSSVEIWIITKWLKTYNSYTYMHLGALSNKIMILNVYMVINVIKIKSRFGKCFDSSFTKNALLFYRSQAQVFMCNKYGILTYSISFK